MVFPTIKSPTWVGSRVGWFHSLESTDFFLWLVARWLPWFQTSHTDTTMTTARRATFMFFLQARKPFTEVFPTLAMAMTDSNPFINQYLARKTGGTGRTWLDHRTTMGWTGCQRPILPNTCHFTKNIPVFPELRFQKCWCWWTSKPDTQPKKHTIPSWNKQHINLLALQRSDWQGHELNIATWVSGKCCFPQPMTHTRKSDLTEADA